MLSFVLLPSICGSTRRRKQRYSQKTGEQLSSSGRPLRQSAAILKAHASNWRLIKGVHHWQSVDDGKGNFTLKEKCFFFNAHTHVYLSLSIYCIWIYMFFFFFFSPLVGAFFVVLTCLKVIFSRPFRCMLPHYPESTSRLLLYAGWLVVFRNAQGKLAFWTFSF